MASVRHAATKPVGMLLWLGVSSCAGHCNSADASLGASPGAAAPRAMQSPVNESPTEAHTGGPPSDVAQREDAPAVGATDATAPCLSGEAWVPAVNTTVEWSKPPGREWGIWFYVSTIVPTRAFPDFWSPHLPLDRDVASDPPQRRLGSRPATVAAVTPPPR